MAAWLAGCTSGDDLPTVAGVDVDGEEDFVPEVSTVPIRFAPVDLMNVVGGISQSDSTTRGTDSQSDFSQDSVGIFCLAKYSNEGLTETHRPSWSGISKKDGGYSVWVKNALASIVTSPRPGQGNITWEANYKDEFNFYPNNDWFAYGFFAYYPYTKNIVYTQSTITTLIRIDGDDDVCYAMAASPKTPSSPVVDSYAAIYRKAFSRAYYEAISEHDPGVDEWIYPHFQFNRIVSRVKFYFRIKENLGFNLHVDRVEVADFPCLMKMMVTRTSGDIKFTEYKNPYVYSMDDLGGYYKKISDVTPLDSAQVPEEYPELKSIVGNYLLKETNGASISGQKNADGSYKYNLTIDKQQVGGYIMIPPVTDGHPTLSKMRLYVTLCDDAGNKYCNKSPLVIPPPVGGYLKGKTHAHTIALANLVPIGSNSEIGEWKADVEILEPKNTTNIDWTSVDD